MKIIILGAGKVGSFVTQDLSNEGHDIVVIDRDKEVLDELLATNDVMGLVGDGRNVEALIEAGAEDCDLFIAISQSDDVNLIASTFAKNLGAKNIIIRMREPRYVKHRKFIGQVTDAMSIVNPEYIAAKDLQRSLKYSHALNVESFFKDRAIMMELVIEEGSALDGKKLSDLSSYSENYHTLIGIINSDGEVNIPHGYDVLKSGDKIYVIGEKEDVDIFYRYEQKGAYDIKNILVIGAGNISKYLVGLLIERGLKVTVVEIDRKKAEDISEMHEEAVVINADGTSPEVLEELRLNHFDALLALTGIDEENIITSMFLESLGIHKNITKVNRTSLLEIIDTRETTTIVTPKSIAVDTVMHFVRGRYNAKDSSLDALHHVANGRIETLQFQIKENNKIAGKKLSELEFANGVLIAAIIRNGKSIFPTGEDRLAIGDKIVIVTLLQNVTHIYDLLKR